MLVAIVPVAYCAYLLYYFLDLSGSVEEAESNGLGPTILGLTIIGLLFLVVLIWRIVRLLKAPRPPKSGVGGGPTGPVEDGGTEFDADAAIARYLAAQQAQRGTVSGRATDISPRRPTFGRKST